MKNIITKDIARFIGLSKLELLLNLDRLPKLCHSKEWVYILSNYWLGEKTILIVEFDNYDRVITLYTQPKDEKL